MIKTLTALTAITVCCLGNGYPAKAHHGGMHRVTQYNANLLGTTQELRQQEIERRLRQLEQDALNNQQNYGY